MPAYWPGLLDGNNATVANTVAKPLDMARPVRTAVECPPAHGPKRTILDEVPTPTDLKVIAKA
jgi:hypothetical protein